MLKNWFLLASVSCGVGFGSTFVISRNLQQSVWAGLGTVPAVAASITILSRQRKQEIERQVAKSRSSLDDVRQQLQLSESSCREIGSHEQELQLTCTQLRQEVERYTLTKRELESTIADLNDRSDRLRTQIAERELYLDKIDRHISRLEAEQNRLSIAVDSLSQALSERQALLQELELDREQISLIVDGLDRSVKDRQSSLNDIDLEICNRRQFKQDINCQITELEQSISLFSVHETGEALNIGIADLYRRWQQVSQQVSQLEDKGNEPSIIATAPLIEAEPSIEIEINLPKIVRSSSRNNVCLFCERLPIPGQDRCNNCN